MARHLLAILALVLATFHTAVAQGPTNMVSDGGFEDVSQRAIQKFRAKAGGWRLIGNAYFQPFSSQSPSTPYGHNYAQLTCPLSDPPPPGNNEAATASHAVAKFVVGQRYVLTYASQLGWQNANATENYHVNFSVMLGDQVLSFKTLSSQTFYPGTWSNTTVSFAPDSQSEGLQVILDCTSLRGFAGSVPQQPFVLIDAFQIIAQV